MLGIWKLTPVLYPDGRKLMTNTPIIKNNFCFVNNEKFIHSFFLLNNPPPRYAERRIAVWVG